MKIKIPIQLIELESNNFHLIVSSTFADGTTGNWVIDTGASKSVFDKSLVEQYIVLEDEHEEIHSAGISDKPIETTIGFLNSFVIKKLVVEHFKVALIDLSHINDLYSKATNLKICGLIGGDFLKKYMAVIDYGKRELVVKNV